MSIGPDNCESNCGLNLLQLRLVIKSQVSSPSFYSLHLEIFIYMCVEGVNKVYGSKSFILTTDCQFTLIFIVNKFFSFI